MNVRVGAGISAARDPRTAAAEAASITAERLDAPADVVLTFVAGHHLGAAEAILDRCSRELEARQMLGCGASGVLGDGVEYEDGDAVAVWAMSAPHADVVAFELAHAGSEYPEFLDAANGVVLIGDPDPERFDAEIALERFAYELPGKPLVGGLASAQLSTGEKLFFGDNATESGAVGVSFSGVELLPSVSQGAVPVGPDLIVTASEGNRLLELGGQPALVSLREAIVELDPEDRERVSSGLLLGVELDDAGGAIQGGEFVMCGLLSGDPDTGSLEIAEQLDPGQILRLHVRDQDSASSDLRSALALRRTALGGTEPAGALAFSCAGRGSRMFDTPNHDARVLEDELGCPAVGIFAGGEIGPVGGRPLMHRFTSTVAVFGAE